MPVRVRPPAPKIDKHRQGLVDFFIRGSLHPKHAEPSLKVIRTVKGDAIRQATMLAAAAAGPFKDKIETLS